MLQNSITYRIMVLKYKYRWQIYLCEPPHAAPDAIRSATSASRRSRANAPASAFWIHGYT